MSSLLLCSFTTFSLFAQDPPIKLASGQYSAILTPPPTGDKPTHFRFSRKAAQEGELIRKYTTRGEVIGFYMLSGNGGPVIVKSTWDFWAVDDDRFLLAAYLPDDIVFTIYLFDFSKEPDKQLLVHNFSSEELRLTELMLKPGGYPRFQSVQFGIIENRKIMTIDFKTGKRKYAIDFQKGSFEFMEE